MRELTAVRALMLAAVLSAALLATPSFAARDQRAPLELVVNGVRREVANVVLRDGDALVPVAALREGGLREVGGARETIGGQDYISLKSLAPSVRFELDEAALALRIDTTAAALPVNNIDLNPSARPEGIVYRRDTSAFLNYSLQESNFNRASAFAEAGLSVQGNLLSTGASLLADGRAVRGLSALTIDEPGKLRRWTVGDAFSGGADLGGGGLIGGLTLAREYSLDPYYVRRPLPRTQSVAVTPSTLDIYVNNVLVRQEQLAPGVYDLSNLPVPAGGGSVRTVVRDAFGRSEEISTRYYLPQSALAKGVDEYRYTAGFARSALGSDSFNYGRPLFLGRHRLGFSDFVTGGFRLEAGRQLFSGGPSATFVLPAGELEFSLAASRQWGHSGGAANLSYGLLRPDFSAGLGVRALSAYYAHASLNYVDDRPMLAVNAFAGLPIASFLNISAELAASRFRDQGNAVTGSLRQDLRLAQNAALSLTESRTQLPGGAGVLQIFASLTFSLGSRSSADASVQRRSDGTGSASAGLQRSLPLGPGFGYRLRGDLDQGALAQVQAQGEHGYYDLNLQRAGSNTSSSLTAAGSIVAINDSIFFARPVQEGFALIQVPGVGGVRGFIDNQEVGRTDSRGDLLVPGIQPYYGNRLSIRDADVPMSYELGALEQIIAAPYRGGAVARFEAHAIRSVQGRLQLGPKDSVIIPSYGELTVVTQGKRLDSPIAKDGSFFLEGLPPGTHQAQIEHAGALCHFALSVPADQVNVQLGTLRCQPGAVAHGRLLEPVPVSQLPGKILLGDEGDPAIR